MLPDRKQMILKAIIENYIASAEPVGSKTLMGSFDRPLSSATIRNEMSELEEMGLLEKQHVSSGRVPSNLAYRLYVDRLMDSYRMAAMELERMRREMENKLNEMDSLLLAASKVVSMITDQTTVVLASDSSDERVRKIELIPMDAEGLTYALVMVCDNTVRNKVLRLRAPVRSESAALLTGFINMSIREDRLQDLPGLLAGSFGENSPEALLAAEVISFISEGGSEKTGYEMYLEGAARLLRNREYQDAEKAGELLEHMADPESVRALVTKGLPGQINIRIGPENEDPKMADASLVFTSYELGNGGHGVIGVVAPKRMDYAKVSAQLSAFVKMLGAIDKNNDKGTGGL